MYNSLSLSILIPIYNQAVEPLVQELSQQASLLNCPFEIICLDDASTRQDTLNANKQLGSIPGVCYEVLPTNKGRSAIRNILASKAQHSHLLFLDCDSVLASPDFVQLYWQQAAAAPIICGGTIYSASPAPHPYTLHWLAGSVREVEPVEHRNKAPYKSFKFNNVFISKEAFMAIQLDEQISTYGHEDTKFGFEAASRSFQVLHIHNPVLHAGLTTADEFLGRAAEAVYNLAQMYKLHGLAADTRLVQTWKTLANSGLSTLFCLCYDRIKPLLLRNLNSSAPRLFYFDLYKLRHFCQAMQQPSA
jgi:glycosyltransferase involved in cell wall biosynthesis